MPTRMPSLDTLQRLADVWSDATSLEDACQRAGIRTKDRRNMQRYRRQAEQCLNLVLPAHNPQHASNEQVNCPSSLDVPAARACRDFIITSATNDSPVVTPFFEALKKFTEHHRGQLLVIPIRYKNPSAFIKAKGYQWDESLFPYVLLDDLHVNKNLVISTVPIQATAVNPLQGMQPVSGTKTAVYGHPQLAMEVVPTPSREVPKMMHTTGSVTRPRYSDTKDGGKAKFNHSISAVYVQVVGTKLFPIQLSWDGKGFYYFDEYWTPDGHTSGHTCAGIVFGDDHVYWERKDVTRARKTLCAAVSPEIYVRHDIHDHHSQSHHNTTLEKIRIARKGAHLVQDELDKAVKYINNNAGPQNWIIRSNHHDAIEKWLNRFNPDHDPHNAPFYFDMMAKLSDSSKCALELYMGERLQVPYKFVSGNDRALIRGIDVSQHGDKGANGARGSLKSFARSSRKMISGHTHTPGIEKGAWSVGCGTDRMQYREGLSSWMLSDCLIYPNGKRALVFYHAGKFRRPQRLKKTA